MGRSPSEAYLLFLSRLLGMVPGQLYPVPAKFTASAQPGRRPGKGGWDPRLTLGTLGLWQELILMGLVMRAFSGEWGAGAGVLVRKAAGDTGP